MRRAKPILHGRDHAPDGADPIPPAGGGVIPYSISGDLTIADGGLRWYAPTDGTIALVHASVGTAPAGSGVTVRLNLNGTAFGAVTISAGGQTASFTPAAGDYSAGAWFTVDVTAVGSTTPGSDLVVQIRSA